MRSFHVLDSKQVLAEQVEEEVIACIGCHDCMLACPLVESQYVSIADLNAMGKHLDKPKGQDDPLNRAILEVLEKIADLEDAGDPEMEEVAIHAAAIRNAFFDDRKRMEDVIPPVLLVTVQDRQELAPRKLSAVAAGQVAARPATVKPAGEKTKKGKR